MIRTSALLGVTALALVAIAHPARADVVVLSDSAFDLADYQLTTYVPTAGFTTNAFQGMGVGGAGALVTTYEKSGSTSPAARFHALNTSFVYDPSADGAITSIDVSFDAFISLFHDTTPVNLANATAQARVMAEQNGKLYIAGRNVFTGLPRESWYNVATFGFVANDFSLFDPDNPFATRTLRELDFTAGPITFGLEIAHFGVLVNGGPSTGLVRSTMAVDNFELTLHTSELAGAVPEPSTWLLMIGGFGLAGGALRRARRCGDATA